VWPAPQGWSTDRGWPGPPDPFLDGGPYDCEIVQDLLESVALRLRSKPDEYTGLTLSREIRIFCDSATVRISDTMNNTSRRPGRWSIWQVTQQSADNHLSMYGTYRQMLGDQIHTGLSLNPQKTIRRIPFHDQVAKFAVMPEGGWQASLNTQNHSALSETFGMFRDATYPDGARAEFWINGHGTFTTHRDRYEGGGRQVGATPSLRLRS